MIKIDFSYLDALPFIDRNEIEEQKTHLNKVYNQLIGKCGKGNDFLGWVDLPVDLSSDLISRVENTAQRLTAQSEIVVVIGIGGSYLGARAVIEALEPYFDLSKKTQILYAGNHFSEDYLSDLLQVLDKKDYSIVVISKSGTTTEPAIALRILKEHCEKKYGVKASVKRIVAITDEKKGALKQMADEKGYETFVIPDDVGGRYSVLTPVGLLPIAIAGFDIRKMIAGAKAMHQHTHQHNVFEENISMQYALLRYLLYRNNKKVELMVAYEPRLLYFIEWFKQLYGESEGKENRGIFPAGAIFSTDLHSLGQYIQEGERMLFETVISIAKSQNTVPIPTDDRNIDALNYLTSKTIQEVNLTAEEGTRMAHIAGGVPNLRIMVPEMNEAVIGELIYFFEFSCALSGYLLDVNPFDQPGVEMYKKNMFKLLGKPE